MHKCLVNNLDRSPGSRRKDSLGKAREGGEIVNDVVRAEYEANGPRSGFPAGGGAGRPPGPAFERALLRACLTGAKHDIGKSAERKKRSGENFSSEGNEFRRGEVTLSPLS